MTTLLTLLAGLAGTVLSAVIGVRVRAWLIEKRIKSNPEMRVGNIFSAVYTQQGHEILGECYLKSMVGKRVVFEARDHTEILNISNTQFQNLWPVRGLGRMEDYGDLPVC